jgi:hypothetical protein
MRPEAAGYLALLCSDLAFGSLGPVKEIDQIQ